MAIQHDMAAAVASWALTPSRAGARQSAHAGSGESVVGGSSDLGDVHCFGTLGSLFRLVGDLGPLRKRAIAVAGDASEVDEQVPAAIVWRDEAEPLVVAEPLDSSRCHHFPLCSCLRTVQMVPEGPVQTPGTVSGRPA